jgi:exopolysaccharide biosynthesis polyprenyl glycosylphosphotransferase
MTILMNIAKKQFGIQITDLIALIITITIQIVVQAIWVSRINYINLIGFNWVTFKNLISLSLLFITWHVFFQFLGVYYIRKIGVKSQEILDVLKVSSIATFVLLVFSNLFWLTFADKLFIVTFWIGSSISVLIARMIYNYTIAKSKIKSHIATQVLIVGTNERASKFTQKLLKNPSMNYNLVGFIDDYWTGLDNFDKDRFDLVGKIDDMKEILKKQVIDEVIVCLPVKTYYDKIQKIVHLCEEQGVLIRFIANIFELKISRSFIDYLDNTPVLTLYSVPVHRAQLIIKRVTDIIFSIIILMIISPLFPLIAILIKIDDNGPVFFTQERVGLNKRLFKLIKFRTMVVNAEELKQTIENENEVSGPVFKIKNDPRLTRIGKFLRRSSLDEIPQFINVLKGEMSLVGPRPPIMSEVEQYEWKNRRRLSMKPGITCIWQISGRSDIPFDKWMELDLEYIDNWSLQTDFEILLKTIPAVIRGSGAS